MNISPPKVIAIAAMDEGRVIGKDNSLIWDLPEDMKRFVALTKGQTVLMGRKTFESTPMKSRPLPKRKNVVCTRRELTRDDIEVTSNPIEYIQQVKAGTREIQGDILWIIGGEQIYRLALPLCDGVELTLVEGKHDGDAFFPAFEDDFTLIQEQERKQFCFRTYKRT